MSYDKLLMKTIAESNYNHKEIVEKLNEYNIHVDKSYLSKLVNGKLPAPREEISRAIAKICNVDERLLVIEGYLDKAPEEIRDLMYSLKKYTELSALAMIKKSMSKQEIDLIEEKIKQEPISDFLISILDYTGQDMLNIDNGNLLISSNKEDFTFKLEEPISFLIKNDDMFPLIPKNAKITLDISNECKSGDIVALKYNDEIIVRYCFINNGIYSFNAINKNAMVIENNYKNVKILGKVKNVITEIQ